ncbi:hypothetical protein AB0C34_01535 [Nocardia sp. NPDC049220]|uniref:hypothetical protein n=1 Tax=Nocardia sp. NPDC049220 TaxID=3155273 RepID=UPI0033C08678
MIEDVPGADPGSCRVLRIEEHVLDVDGVSGVVAAAGAWPQRRERAEVNIAVDVLGGEFARVGYRKSSMFVHGNLTQDLLPPR